MNTETCPHCGEEWNNDECLVCGFANVPDKGIAMYETPTGRIVWCTEEEAFDQNYIFICPSCCYNVITWWEKEDHNCCIECWHKNNRMRLTKKK